MGSEMCIRDSGCLARRFFDGVPYDGRIIAWLPMSKNDVLWKLQHHDGDEEELELYEVEDAVRAHDLAPGKPQSQAKRQKTMAAGSRPQQKEAAGSSRPHRCVPQPPPRPPPASERQQVLAAVQHLAAEAAPGDSEPL